MVKLKFISNMLKKKKMLKIDDMIFDNHRTRSEPSVVSYSCAQNKFNSISTLSLTPGRCRPHDDIDNDMHELRLSRQDNPFIQKVLASRESLLDLEEMVSDNSDDAILMSQDFNSQALQDPFQMPELHEHMIRSPPPNTWPRIFSFPQENNNNNTITSHSSDESNKSAVFEVFTGNSQVSQPVSDFKHNYPPEISSAGKTRPQSSHGSTIFK